jgi:phosphoribosylaminoimidazole carboxylase PurE protein
MREAAATLTGLGVPSELRVSSAHRTPLKTLEYAMTAADRGLKVIIAGAGMAAHLAGFLASSTMLPVIGVPLSGSPLSGMDALLSVLQMPPGVPVATVAVNGARNAAILAAQILALNDPELDTRLKAARRSMLLAAEEADRTIA